jgi:hypothetical protein
MTLFVRHVMENPWSLGFLSAILIGVPIAGIWAIHKYGWEHWQPFSDGKHN